eukprot:5553309-Pleurochrysis_carterae.AAC.1
MAALKFVQRHQHDRHGSTPTRKCAQAAGAMSIAACARVRRRRGATYAPCCPRTRSIRACHLESRRPSTQRRGAPRACAPAQSCEESHARAASPPK